MAYGDFKYPDVLRDFGLTQTTVTDLFADIPPVSPSAGLAALLPKFIMLGTTAHSEAARSTWIVGPILGDLWSRHVGRLSLHAGIEFNVDAAARLTGNVDFILGRGPMLPVVAAPVMFIVEAKRDSIPGGLGQCISGMVGMQRFNEQSGTPIDPVYGCVTTGSLWRFLRLSGTTVALDLNEYLISQTDKLLGILSFIAQTDRPAAAA